MKHKNDTVNHPAHYTQGRIECIEAIKAALTPDEFVGFLKGQILKYTWRSGHKDDICQDTAKGIWYAQYLIGFVNEQRHPIVCAQADSKEKFVPTFFEIEFHEQWEVWGTDISSDKPQRAYMGCALSYLEARASIPLDKYRPM